MKLIVVQNELKSARGHYLETAVAVAEAAGRLGLTAYVLGHATCPSDLLPPGIPFLPICRLDHQMHGPPLPSLAYGPYRVTVTCDPTSAGPAPPSPALTRLARAMLPPIIPKAARLLLGGAKVTGVDPFDAVGQSRERHNIEEWRKDLAFALTLLQPTADDHVFFLTAHARELHAVRQVVEALPPHRCPTFHLEFRHALNFTEPERRPLDDFTAIHLALYDLYRPLGPHPRIRLYTDTPELSDQYSSVAQLAHFTLPIPFRVGKLSERNGSRVGPVRLTYVGDPRDEKGFHRLPGLVEALAGADVLFVIQAGLVDPANNPQSKEAVRRLRALPPDRVQLVGLDGPLPADRYFELVSQANVLLFPFDRTAYRRRSSGTLTEAIAAGVPTVVPEGTWLASQQPAGTGEAYHDDVGLVAAVRRVAGEWERYAAAALAARGAWRRVHTPENLVRMLISGEPAA